MKPEIWTTITATALRACRTNNNLRAARRLVARRGKGALICLLVCLATRGVASAQQTDREIIDQLVQRLAASERRIQVLEAKLAPSSTAVLAESPAPPPRIPQVAESLLESAPAAVPAESPAPPSRIPKAAESLVESAPAPSATAQAPDMIMGGHNMEIPGGPVLNIKGFFDFNFGVGTTANPLVFPIADNGCGTCGNPATPPHSAFQAGEMDLFLSSKISDHLSFVTEMVFGPDTTNEVGIDIERYQLTYRASPYFSMSAGRFHTSIGYYNTAYHHGNWFSTAEGRPIMYLFEDSGGVLPVHMVGVTFTGAVPHTEKLGLHWVAEVGNGRSSNPAAQEPVQNFYSDRNFKAFNLAAYIKPDWLTGLQMGGSYYHDRLAPPGLPRVNQNIGSIYAVYFTSNWEFLNEAVMLSNQLEGTRGKFRSPMAYTQVARKFGIYKPYLRYQYVNDRPGDPVNIVQGTYYGPSVGLRIDFAEFAAFKVQYNRLSQSNQLAGNGLNSQLAFTF
jgi:hypothetical protein